MIDKILSLSIAAYNVQDDLRRCLDSLVYSPVVDLLDVIVVNDGSTDDTYKVAKEYQKAYPDVIRIINKDNGGHGSTINSSIKEVRGKFYRILDADDSVDLSGIEKLVHALDNSTADLVLNPFYTVDATTLKQNSICYPYGKTQTIGNEMNVDDVNDIVIHMHSATYRTDIVKKMGPIIDEHCFYVDMEYTLFPLRYVRSVICFDFPVYKYYVGSIKQSMYLSNLIERRSQHLKVTKRVIDYYEDVKNSVPEGIRNIILRRVKYAFLNQNKIYYFMKLMMAKEEAMLFDGWVKRRSPEVYKGPEGSFMYIVRLNRITNYSLFTLTTKLLGILCLNPKI